MRSSLDIQCIVVHHKNYPAVLRTIRDILESDVPPTRILVVDNGEDLEIASALRDSLPQGVALVETRNRGYAAAVNAGVRWWSAQSGLTLVSTHEVRLNPHALSELVRVISRSPRIAVVGPILHAGSLDGEVWSRGGTLSRVLRLPGHRQLEPAAAQIDYEVEWLDGAIGLYRTPLLEAFPLREEFFLYFEETELHVRLRKQGFQVRAVPLARASQDTLGMPAQYKIRNTVIFNHLHGTRLSRLLAPTYVFTRETILTLARRRRTEDIPALVAGWKDGRRVTKAVS